MRRGHPWLRRLVGRSPGGQVARRAVGAISGGDRAQRCAPGARPRRAGPRALGAAGATARCAAVLRSRVAAHRAEPEASTSRPHCAPQRHLCVARGRDHSGARPARSYDRLSAGGARHRHRRGLVAGTRQRAGMGPGGGAASLRRERARVGAARGGARAWRGRRQRVPWALLFFGVSSRFSASSRKALATL